MTFFRFVEDKVDVLGFNLEILENPTDTRENCPAEVFDVRSRGFWQTSSENTFLEAFHTWIQSETYGLGEESFRRIMAAYVKWKISQAK